MANHGNLMPSNFCSKAVASQVCCGMCGGQSGWCATLKLVHIAHGGRTPMSNLQKGINILCWWCAGPVCSVGWCGCPGQCASVPGGGQSVQCQASASPSPAAVHRQASHHLYHRRQHAHQIITNTSHMCRPSAEHSCINKKSQPEVELRESL